MVLKLVFEEVIVAKFCSCSKKPVAKLISTVKKNNTENTPKIIQFIE